MAMHLGGTSIPTSIIDGGGHYDMARQQLRKNGDGEAVVSGYYTLTWTFPQMSLTDFTWIVSTLMSGAASVTYSSAELYNRLGALTSYTNAVAYEPTYDTAHGGWIENVTWIIDRIR